MRVSGTVTVPGDKSISHRALMCAALAPGVSHLEGVLPSLDLKSTARVLRLVGVQVSRIGSRGRVQVRGGPWTAPGRSLHCGNSGTTARLMLGLLAGHGLPARLTGDRSLRQRPMQRVTEPLRMMGTSVRESQGGGLPVVLSGGVLSDLSHRMPVASAQVKSALIFAGLVSGVAVALQEPVRSRDHTERMLRELGVAIATHGNEVSLSRSGDGGGGGGGGHAIEPFVMRVPGDFSSTAFVIAVALLATEGELLIKEVGVNPTRTGMLDMLRKMGAAVELLDHRVMGGEPVADLLVRPSNLSSGGVAHDDVPRTIDEIPILAVLASRADGDSVFHGVGELRVKESNRLELLAQNLRAVGAHAEATGDDLFVRGGAPTPVGTITTEGDHRIAMAFSVLGLLPGARIELSEEQSPATSFPGFAETVRSIVR